MERPFSAGFQPSSTELKPLAPPRGCTNWIYKEPAIFEHLHSKHVEREARKVLNIVYRRSLQSMGEQVCLVKPSRGTFPPPEASFRYNRAPRNRVFGPLPFLPSPSPPSLFRNSMPKSRSLPSGLVAVKDSEAAASLTDQRAMINGDRSRMGQTVWRSLEDWSRHAHGAPFSLKQVYEEIEADCLHRRSRDTRAKSGNLGPEVIGSPPCLSSRWGKHHDATRQRRAKPHFTATGDSTRARHQSMSMRSISSTATDVTSLPAIADAKPVGDHQTA